MKNKIKYKRGTLVVETGMTIQDDKVFEDLQEEYKHDGNIVIVRNKDSNLEIVVALLENEPIAAAIKRARFIAIQVIESAKFIQDKSKKADTDDIRKRILENIVDCVKTAISFCGLKAENIGVTVTVADIESGDITAYSDVNPMMMAKYWTNIVSEKIVERSFNNSREANQFTSLHLIFKAPGTPLIRLSLDERIWHVVRVNQY